MATIIRQYTIQMKYFNDASVYTTVDFLDVQKVFITTKEITAPEPDSFGRLVHVGYDVKLEWTILHNSGTDIYSLLNHLEQVNKKNGGAYVLFQDSSDSAHNFSIGIPDPLINPTSIKNGVKPIAIPKLDGNGKYEGVNVVCNIIMTINKLKTYFPQP